MSPQNPEPSQRLERVFAYMVAGVIGASILAFIAVMIGTATGAGADDGFSKGVWPFVFMFPLVGLPIGFALIIALMVVSSLRRSRAARENKR
ncbi:hypothetical protein [Microterricola viridarii]|uniref:Multidrug ABC transporter ATPase n=1 Tax=Microterricola viridarii TaxID=412690 RepID=A0A0X8E497_9MICO|nr:hypothetical protein [Microterricola viridarii]AMB59277.1 hypothetical protein AWU67_10855 [Microterricola viridarii]